MRDLPQSWEIKKLVEVFQIKPPKKEAKEKLLESELVTFLPMEDLGIAEKEIQPTQARTLREVAGSYTYFAENDVLLAKITPCFENKKLGSTSPLLLKTMYSLEPKPIPFVRFFATPSFPFSKQGVIFASNTSSSAK
jgi:hypothetical protein